MKLILLKNRLVEALASVERAIATNTNLPILKNVLIRVVDGKVVFTATNLEFAVQHSVPGKVFESGDVCVPFATIASIVKNITDERITCEKKGETLIVSTENYEADIQSQVVVDFPLIPVVKGEYMTITAPANIFMSGIVGALTAAQYSEIRPEISGVYIHCEAEQIVFVGTDGFRLAERIISGQFVSFQNNAMSRDCIIPIRVAEELVRIFNGVDVPLTVHVDENQIFFESGDIKVTSRLVDGKFPEYRAIVPKSFVTRVTLNRGEFVQAIRLTSSLTGKTNDLTVTLDEKIKTVTLSAADSGRGENKCSIPCRVAGDSFSFVVNWKYLLDGVRLYGGEDIILTTTERPVSITSQSEHGTLYLLMPIKT